MLKTLAVSATLVVAANTITAKADDLNVTLRGSNRGIVINNPNAFDLGECTVYVNSKFKLGSNFRIPRGSSAEVWYSELMTRNDVRFDPSLDRLQRVFVNCRKPSTMDASFSPSS
ncbi:hypothetical protein [Microvirga massiliensis]|uniref:hypothetical protein n=1 Tax=Microvirga massiliensis TaxID=1033741 RepID=UPI00062BD7BA|nr:hypothetical protein [Microvirga massiliensis]